uniref:cytochrome c oxidase subunit III n=1 Tax=Dipterophagus daci TaxID=2800156 RepID=UPI001D0FCB70|nr:cytochrome c oxidase subunit III [Dipterophagus daci]QZO77417.1 cytochrome c oxidase subunit 3 [Dipterophagus daci]
MIINYQPYLLYNLNPWPFLISLNMLSTMINYTYMSKYMKYQMFIFTLILLMWTMFMWFNQLFYESIKGKQTYLVFFNLKLNFILFILTEMLLFSSLFWNFFNSFDQFNWMSWPPNFIQILKYQELPLLNTLILLTSSLTMSTSHMMMIMNNYKKNFIFTNMTIILSLYFISLQIYEFNNCKFNINDSIYSNSFFIITGLHGLHVIFGTILLLSTIKFKNWYFLTHHFNMNLATWYWHFVDMIWLFVYSLIYWLVS